MPYRQILREHGHRKPFRAGISLEELSGCIGEEQYRFLVVHSSKPDGRKARSLKARFSKRKRALEKRLKTKLKKPTLVHLMSKQP